MRRLELGFTANVRRLGYFFLNQYSYIKQSDMIHPENWQKLSSEFSVSIGMLIWNGDTPVEETIPITELNRLIIREIARGNYNETRRKFLRLERTARKDMSELTLYKKAIKSDIRAKSKEVF